MEEINSKLENGVLVIDNFEADNFEAVKNNVLEFISEPKFNVEILSDLDYKDLKQARTEINKRQKEITDGRIKITRAFCGEFEAKCKEIEKILKDKSAEIGDKLKAYKEAKEPENKMKIYTIEVKTADINLIAKIKTLCEKANCEINFKEE